MHLNASTRRDGFAAPDDHVMMIIKLFLRSSGKNLSPTFLSLQILPRDNLKGRNVGIIDERDLLFTPLRCSQMA
jgi:hypothetical protein